MMPFVFEDASRPEAEYQREDATFSRVELNTRLQSRAFDLRVRERDEHSARGRGFFLRLTLF